MRKVIRDGKVAVLYSPGFGAGWFSWHHKKELLFLPEIVELIENTNDRDSEKLKEILQEIDEKEGTNYSDVYLGGFQNLKIKWLDEGTEFVINEYDGSECIKTRNNVDWLIA